MKGKLVVWDENPQKAKKARWWQYWLVWYHRRRLVRAMKKSGIWDKMDKLWISGKTYK